MALVSCLELETVTGFFLLHQLVTGNGLKASQEEARPRSSPADSVESCQPPTLPAPGERSVLILGGTRGRSGQGTMAATSLRQL